MVNSATIQLVSIRRKTFDTSPWYGFVVGESAELVAVQKVSDRYDLDGYRVIHRRDITEIRETFERKPLIETALELKGLTPCIPVALDLSGIRELMESVQSTYGVLVINREALHSDEVEVGTVRMTSQEAYVLRWLTANAEWENDDRPFRYRDVTMLEFGGEYEETLIMVVNARGHSA